MAIINIVWVIDEPGKAYGRKNNKSNTFLIKNISEQLLATESRLKKQKSGKIKYGGVVN